MEHALSGDLPQIYWLVRIDSDVVFGLLHLLGFDYRPHLADLPDAKLWRINRTAGYGPLDATARGIVDLDRIRWHWPGMLRIAGL